jgi:LysR family glycine cleavage system transcriptional activator
LRFLLGRPDWWALWFAAQAHSTAATESFVAPFAVEHLDVGAAIAGQGIAIGSRSCSRPSWTAGGWCRRIRARQRRSQAFWFVAPGAKWQCQGHCIA